ncbi:hypothetical protein QJQ45_028841, partial [Haematococcus lacustris]
IVAVLQLIVLRDAILLSDSAAAAITSAAGSAQLPYRLPSILSLPSLDHAAYLDSLNTLQQQQQQQQQQHGSWAYWRHKLPAILLGRTARDASDVQWREFRGSLGRLAAGLGLWAMASRWLRAAGGPSPHLAYLLLTSLLMLGGLHGATSMWVVLLLGCSFLVSRVAAGRAYGPVAVALVLSPAGPEPLRPGPPLLLLLLLLLPQAAAAVELASERPGGSAGHPGLQGPAVRVEAPRPLGQYSLVLYCVYCLYPPLYIAGPIMTHNDFVAQLQGPGPSRPSWRQVLVYSLRWCGALAALELLTRCLLVNAVAKYGLLTSRLDLLRGWLPGPPSPLHFALVGFWVLVFMWLKFLVIWRFFHCLALLEGVEPPENMGRCVCNNYDIEGFWRGWHCSYNRWLVRYLYIPLGGATRRLLVIWPVFLFVALWHDLEPRLLHWGLLMPAAFCPELVVKAAAKLPLLARHRQRWWYRQVAALLASCNILALMTANLAGFVVGVEGVGPLVRQVLGQPAMAGGVLGTLFCAVQLMFAIRQREDAEKQGRVATA